jgi:hypothetical protein
MYFWIQMSEKSSKSNGGRGGREGKKVTTTGSGLACQSLTSALQLRGDAEV